MKRKMFSILAIAAIAMTSCKKDEPVSSELRDATINGNVWADMDQTDNDVEGVEGMTVKVEVNTMSWDQQPDPSYTYDKRVYTAVTDANGDYTLTIPATEDGYNITIQFEDLYTTRTTASGSQDVKVTRGNITKSIYAGAVISTKDEATVALATGAGSESGEAWITGKIYVQYDISNNANPLPGDQLLNTASALGQQPVNWKYNGGVGPWGITNEAVTSVNIDLSTGTYTLSIATEGLSGNNVCVDFGILDFAGSQSATSPFTNNDTTYVGHYTDGGGVNANFDCISAGEIINYDIYLGFVDHN
jgi:hypothetical protein